jgi:hypothetical protein
VGVCHDVVGAVRDEHRHGQFVESLLTSALERQGAGWPDALTAVGYVDIGRPTSLLGTLQPLSAAP